MIALALTALYGVVATLLGVYFFRTVGLTLSAQAAEWESPPPLQGNDVPMVSVQLPLHNERSLAPRLLAAVCTMDYPADRLHIQVLDDSTDPATSALLQQEVTRWQAQGTSIAYYRRGSNEGYKAGNLAYGFKHARGEFIAIFDADFIPEAGWLRQALAHFDGVDDLGMVQMRWWHRNTHDSWLTRAETLTVDFYSLAQAVRTRMGLWSSFYGSAGVWRRACIEDAGGWSTATLTEDLDLAYRAQLAGWRLGYDHSLLASAELPTRLIDYKRQQFRWARGNLQVMRRLLPRLAAPGLPLLAKLDALLFGTWAVSHLLVVCMLSVRLLLLAWPPSLWLTVIDALVAIGTLANLLPVVGAALRERKVSIPTHVLLGTGISLNNTVGMLTGLLGKGLGAFNPTPKGEQARGHVPLHWSTVGELTLGLLASTGFILASATGVWLVLPMFGLHALSFGWVGGNGLWETITEMRNT